MKKYRIVVTEIQHLTHEPDPTDKVITSSFGFDIYDLLAESVVVNILGVEKCFYQTALFPKLFDDFSEFLKRDLGEYLRYVMESADSIPNTSLISRIFDMHLEKISRPDYNFSVFIPEEMDDE